MPAKNPRLTITMQPSLAAQLRRMSELTGNSQSAMIAELLETSSPMFERLIVVLEAAQKVTQQAKDVTRHAATSMSSDLAEAQTKLEAQMGLQLENFDRLAKPLLEEAERVSRRSRRTERAPRAAADGASYPQATPPSNRGVRSNKTNAGTRVQRGKNHGSI